MKCEFCGREEALPFVCNYCGGAFCPDHRLPEAHQCKGDLSQKRTIVAPPQTTFSWQEPSVTGPMGEPVQARVFSGVEIRDILIAWLALGVAFSFALSGGGLYLFIPGSGITSSELLFLVGLSLVTAGPGFVFHELSHKFVARRYGYWAEFRMWPSGLVFGLFTSLLGPFIFAAPGATYISGMNISKSQNGWISVAGPATNLVIALIFLPMVFVGGSLVSVVGIIGFKVNSLLGLFNMIPLGPLDGAKVIRWNLPLWIAVAAALLGFFVYSFNFVL